MVTSFSLIIRATAAVFLISFCCGHAAAACGATNRTWDGGNGTNGTNGNYWSTNGIWDSNNRPDTSAENAIVPSAGVGYLWMFPTDRNYFRALTPSSVYYGAGTGRIVMAGTAAQTLEMVDTIPNVRVTNNTSVTFPFPFKSLNALDMQGATSTVNIDASYEIINNSTLTIPSGNTVRIRSGASVKTAGNVLVAGTLIIEAGGQLELANGRTLTVQTGGLIQLKGSDGNPASVLSPSGGTFTFTVQGSFSGEFFNISRTNTNGVNVSGTIQKMEDGEFHYIANGGYGVRIQGSANLPASGRMDNLGFFNENGGATGNLNASAYVGTAGEIELDNWSGDIGGDDFDTENAGCGSDPPGCFDFQTEADTQLTMTNVTASGSPPASIGGNSADTLFATYAFALTKDDVDSDITSLTITQIGTASITEIDDLKFYEDTNGNCTYNAGTDLQIGADLNLTGTPQQATLTIPAGVVRVTDASPVCLHLVSATSSLAVRNNTISFEVSGTADVVNSNGYPFSSSSGPPINTGLTAIVDGFASQWTGNSSTSSTTNANWFLNDPPSATENCQIGPGERICQLNANLSCKTAELPVGGTLNFNNRDFDVFGNLTVAAGYTFTNAAGRTITLRAAVNQGVNMGEAFPGSLVVNNTGSVGNDKVIATGSSEVQGDVSVNNGNLIIGNGVTFTVGGDMTIANGASVTVEPGGTLQFSNGSVLTVDTGGTLTLVGSASSNANMTSISTSDGYSVVVNGTLSARYYSVSRLGSNGFRVNPGATIDGSNHLQNGTFTYPVSPSTTMLRLFRAVPTNTMDNMSFSSGGSSAASPVNIYTDASIGAGTLTIDNYSGDLAGTAFDNDNTYLLSWTGATNTLEISQDATAPATLAAGDTVIMGRWKLQQSLAGASYSDTDITSLKVTMTGTANSSTVDDIRIYYDSDCNSAGGNLLGTMSPTGSPGSATFSLAAAAATIEQDDTSPPERCIYVEYSLSSAATDGKSLGAQLTASTSLVNSEAYAASGSVIFPVALGTGTITGSNTTIWTGNTSTDWFTASNWTFGVPTAALSCEIPSAANNPIISGGTAACLNVDKTGGSLTWASGTGATLEVYGNFENVGPLNQNDGALTLRDDGATTTNQRIETTTTISNLTFNKTAGGEIQIGGGVPVNLDTLSLSMGQNFTIKIPAANTLALGQSLSIPVGITLSMEGSSNLRMASGTSLNVVGGTFQTNGVNDAYPQSTSNKASIAASSGRFSFVATSGTVSLRGFLIDGLTVNGLQVNGTANLTNLDGGQFINLLTDFSNPVRAISLNTVTTITETTASNIGFMWGGANSTYSSPPSPLPPQNYFLVHASGCGSQSLSFNQWFGDFWGTSPQPVTQDKILDSADDPANLCTVAIDASASPVSITAMDATAYDAAVDVTWSTGAEVDHRGFNVYRSQNANSGYVQINTTLIQNMQNSGDGSGEYIFRDQTVSNGVTFYYYIEDVAFNGTTTMHGPVDATPHTDLATAPPLGDASGNDSIHEEPNGTAPEGDNGVSLAPDVHIVSSSSSTFRIQITPLIETTEVSSWDPSYNTIHIPYFSHVTRAGHPELLERTVLVPVDRPQTGVSFFPVDIAKDPPVVQKIAPAPSWSLAEGTLQPSWNLDNEVYDENKWVFETPYEVLPDTVKIGSDHFIAIKVWPVAYNPVTESYVRTHKVVLDVFTGNTAWDSPPEPIASTASPLSADSVAIMAFQKTGIFEVSYEDLVASNADGPFVGAMISDIRAYFQDQEVAIEVESDNETFDSGDKVRFFGAHHKSMEDENSYLVLASRDLFESGTPASRMEPVSSPPESSSPTLDVTEALISFEENNMPFFDLPMGGHVDHYFWKRLVVSQGTAGGAGTKFNFDVDLSTLAAAPGVDVHLNIDLRGRGTNFGASPGYKLGVTLNGETAPVATVDFQGNNKQIVSVAIPSLAFQLGTNTIHLEALADNLTPNEFALIDLDKIEVSYERSLFAGEEGLSILKRDFESNVRILGFQTEPLIYDISHLSQVQRVTNYQWSPAGVEDSEVLFKAPSGFLTDIGGNPLGISGISFFAAEPTQFHKVRAISMSQWFPGSLRDVARQADYIVIGTESALNSVAPLIQHRQAQGLTTARVPVQQIYNEFSNGQRSALALKAFLSFARTQWQDPKVRYVLIVGDATTDPMDHEGLERSDSPMSSYLVQGEHSDFPSDSILVADQKENGSWVPAVAIGRIPTSDHQKIFDYVNKLITYENGEGLSDAGKNKMVFISDKSLNSEGFDTLSGNLKQTAISSFSELEGTDLLKSSYGSDAETKKAIIDIFNVSQSFLVSLNGHGAENMWSTLQTFTSADALALSNTTSQPLVISLNCLNSYHQTPDPSMASLGEAFVLQKNGSIAFWGSTALTTPRVQESLATNFFAHMGQQMRSRNLDYRVGDSVLTAQNLIGDASGFQDVLLSWSFIGDPAMKLPMKVYPAPTPAAQSPEEPNPADDGTLSGPGSSASGCSAFAGSHRDERHPPWPLVFGIFLEMALLLAAIRVLALFGSRKKRETSKPHPNVTKV